MRILQSIQAICTPLIQFGLVLLVGAAPAAAGDLMEVRSVLSMPDRLPLIVEKRRSDISRFYNSESARLLWTGQTRSGDLVGRMVDSDREGLRPEDYPSETLTDARSSLGGSLSPSEEAWVELLLTGHFLDFASDVRAGRVSPRFVYPDAYMPINTIDAFVALERFAKSGSLGEFLSDWEPQGDTYRRLKSHLQQLLAVQDAGGFTYLEIGEILTPGTDNSMVPALRQRLFEDGLVPGVSSDRMFDKRLAFAVAQAQNRYGVDVSGKLGIELVRALNIPVGRRIEQIINSMERIRWLPERYAGLLLVINKGENQFQFIESGRVELEGEAFGNCPERNFTNTAATVEGVTFNPTWQVSLDYIADVLLPRLRSDPEAVASEGFYLRRSGADVPLSAIPWKQITRRTLGRYKGEFALYLASADENPLGRYAYRLRRENSLTLLDLENAPEDGVFCDPLLPLTSFGLVDGLQVLERIIDPRLLPPQGVEKRIARADTVTYPTRAGILAIVSHASAWVGRQGTIRFGKDPYLEDARLSAALAGRVKP